MAEKNKTAKRDRNRKSGQNIAYIAEHRHEKSHIRRIKIHIKRYGYATDAADALLRYATRAGLRETSSANEFIKQART